MPGVGSERPSAANHTRSVVRGCGRVTQHEKLELLRPLRTQTKDKQLEQTPQHPIHEAQCSNSRSYASSTQRRSRRGSSDPRSALVVKFSNTPRTQDGHIRNDTRDVSRRTPSVPTKPNCRRKCVPSDRACTRVTPGNLHGKEGVDGSSPSEGSKRPANRDFVLSVLNCR
jgi:hypothetical protein